MRSLSRPASVLCVVGWIVFLPACTDGQLQGAKAEVKETTIKLDLPKVPDFDMPSPHPDGTHTVREMRLKGRKLFNTEQRIRGFVTWQYDCVAALRTPELTSKQVKRMIANDPSRCVVPHFYLGDGADTPAEKSLWVVEVPRKLRKDELRLLTRRERRKLPSVPVLNLGDEVVVIGTWDKLSPRGFANSDGLLVYKSIEVVTRASNRRQGSPDDEG